jgi:hypothetical protein
MSSGNQESSWNSPEHLFPPAKNAFKITLEKKDIKDSNSSSQTVMATADYQSSRKYSDFNLNISLCGNHVTEVDISQINYEIALLPPVTQIYWTAVGDQECCIIKDTVVTHKYSTQTQLIYRDFYQVALLRLPVKVPGYPAVAIDTFGNIYYSASNINSPILGGFVHFPESLPQTQTPESANEKKRYIAELTQKIGFFRLGEEKKQAPQQDATTKETPKFGAQ